MFEIAVIGPLAGDRLGVVQQCIRCRAALGPDAPDCPGFGPGCLATPSRNISGNLPGNRSGGPGRAALCLKR